ncbi:MAG: signal recognition particle protein Srp54 [Candidatus Thermoplasmatota archaeon]|nr:signal recognition particle protein Srp54 [Candidatus Thermoplasmatota archaeon]
MVLENLGGALKDAIKKIANASHVDQKLVKEVVKDIQRALLQADINVKLVISMTKELEQRALTEKPPAGMSSREHVIKIVYEELVKLIGKGGEIPAKPQRILMVGLYGQGKTTTSGKLAKDLHKRGMKVGLVAADVHRPAAFDQLTQIGAKINVPVFGDPKEKSAVKIAKRAMKEFEGYDVIIFDTSGRHALEADLIDEIESVAKIVDAEQKILVLDAQTGQQAGPQAKAFHDAVHVTGVIITKLDGTAKGGGALSAVAETGAPICYVGVGEHLEDIERFDPDRFISRLLGMGDIKSLIEVASEVMDEEKAEEAARKMMSGKFSLKEMYDQMEMLQGMGPLKKIASMLPGMSDKLQEQDMEATQERLVRFRVIMDSMTEEELENPKLIKSSRIIRVARGSGTTTKEVKELLKQYDMSKKAMKGFMGNRKMRRQLMKQFKGADFSKEA